MATHFVRQDIWKLEQQQPGHPITKAYASAIAVMKGLDSNKPTSLAYQAAVHGGAVQDKFLSQCQHHTWFFLSWHRLYLYWFEQIVRKIIQGLDDVDDQTKDTWALPYWNYWDTRPPEQATQPPFVSSLPVPFRDPPNPATNPLFLQQRNRNINRGFLINPLATSAELALLETEFSRPVMPGVPPGFGGPPVGLHHGFDGPQGPLERTPHGAVHGAVGGFMGDPDTAGLDPIFWLHHANIDRLWDVWLKDGQNPTDDDWLIQEFHFHNADGNEVTNTARQLEELIDYSYPDVPPPAGPLEARAMRRGPEPDHPAELVGATAEPMVLAGDLRTARFGISRPAGPLSEAGAEPSRVYLNVEDIQAERNPGISYGVYVDVPDEDEDPTNDAHYVGNITFFGIEQAQDLDRDHPGGHGGLSHAFDITDLYTRLRDAGLWNEEQITVTFAPLRVQPPPDAGPASAELEPEPEPEESTPVRIGRVSIFYQ
jgi:tyrosinase